MLGNDGCAMLAEDCVAMPSEYCVALSSLFCLAMPPLFFGDVSIVALEGPLMESPDGDLPMMRAPDGALLVPWRPVVGGPQTSPESVLECYSDAV